MDSQRESRKRLRPWLERMIESNTCPGLVWENKEERTFRIPWRHFNNKDWDEKYSKIFMEWARHTGKYHEGDKLEYPVWKTRLRCALKKIPEILELQEQHHPEDPDPYRVYKFVDSPSMKKFGDIDSEYSASPGSSSSFLMNSPTAKDYLETSVTPPPQQYFENTFLGPKQSSNVPTVVYDEESFNYNNLSVKTEDVLYPHGFASTGRETQYDHAKLDQGQFQGQFADFNHYNISSEPNFLDQMSSSSQNYSGLNSIVATSRPELSLLESSLLAAGNENIKASLPSDLMSVESSDLCAASISDDPSLSVLQDRHSSSNVHVMQLNVKYGFPSNTVLQNKVGVNGCRLYFGAPQLQHTSFEEELFGPKTVTQIEMPDVMRFTQISEEQKVFICELLDSMERGLVLTYKDGDIYAQRLCRTRVFVSDGVTESRLLHRKEKTPTKVFDFAAFKASLESYHTTKLSEIPKYHFFLTFGQELRKNRSDPMGRVLIHAQVVHSEAEEYSKMSFSDASHSLVPLMSSFDTYDNLLQRFKNMTVHK